VSAAQTETRHNRGPKLIEEPPTPSPGAALDSALARKVLEAAPNIIYVYDVQREQSVFQNRRFGELLGHPPSEPGQSEWMVHIHEDDAASFRSYLERLKAIAPGETTFWEFRMRDSDGNWRWFMSRDALLTADDAGKPHLIVGSASDITEQKRAEQHKELLADEMRHRARNLVSVVQAIGRMSRPKNQPEVARHVDAFMGRLLTLLNTGSIVLSSTSRMAKISEVAQTALEPFQGTGAARIALHGTDVILSEHTSASLALALHELATNAAKYGALSCETGRVALKWELVPSDAGSRFTMSWTESGGPLVQEPAAEGFGARVIRQSVARERNGTITIDYRPSGLICRFEFDMPEKI